MPGLEQESNIKRILRNILSEIEMASEQGSAAIRIIRDKKLATEEELLILGKHSANAAARFEALRKQIDSLEG
jgi:hypothetical protein